METLSFKDYGGKFLLYCNFRAPDLPDHLPSFYKDCLNVWSKLAAKPAESRDEVLKKSCGTINSYASIVNPSSTEDFSQRVSFSSLTF